MSMKQEPLCPSTDLLSISSDLPKKISVFSEGVNSWNIKVISLVAILFNILIFLFIFLCLHIKKDEVPLSSAIQVEFEEVVKPIPNINPMVDNQSLPSVLPEKIDKIDLPEIKILKKITPIDKNKIVSKAQQKDMTLVHPVKKMVESEAPHDHSYEQDKSQLQKTKHSLTTVNQSFPEQRCSPPRKVYPLAARRRHEQGVVKIALQILPNGQLKQVHLVESSGFTDLDKVGMEAVQSINCKKVEGNNNLINTTVSVVFGLNHY